MMRIRASILYLIIPAFMGLWIGSSPAKAQSFTLATNNVAFNFTTLGLNPSLINSVTVKSMNTVSAPNAFFAHFYTNFTIANNANLITNGTVILKNVVYGLGVTYQVQISDGYTVTTTNFCIPSTASFDSNTNTPANQWIGNGLAPNFTWSTPLLTNINYTVGNVTNSLLTNSASAQTVTGPVNMTNAANVLFGQLQDSTGSTITNNETSQTVLNNTFAVNTPSYPDFIYMLDSFGTLSLGDWQHAHRNSFMQIFDASQLIYLNASNGIVTHGPMSVDSIAGNGTGLTNIPNAALQQAPITNYAQIVSSVNTSIGSYVSNPQTYSGTFNGAGGISNAQTVLGPVAASQLSGAIPQANIPSFVVTNLPASNGTNDYALWQAVCSVPNSVIVANPTLPYWSSNSISVTNNVFIDGRGGWINFARGITNSLFDGTTNIGISFVDLRLNGLEASNYNSVATIPTPINLAETYDSSSGSSGLSVRGSSVRNRNGIRINGNGGGKVQGCTFYGFSGCGLLNICYHGTESYKFPSTRFYSLVASNNFIGFYSGGGYWDGIPSFGFVAGLANYDAASFAYDSGEYCQIIDSTAVNSGIGFYWYGGNSKVVGCLANNNFMGYAATAGPNSAHGAVDSCTFNHNTYPLSMGACPQDFRNCVFYANTFPAQIANAASGTFTGCRFDGNPAILITNAGSPTSVSSASVIACSDAAVTGPANLVSVTTSNCFAVGFANFGDTSSANGQWSITNSTSLGSGVLSFGGLNAATLYGTVNAPVADASVVSSNWLAPIGAWGSNATTAPQIQGSDGISGGNVVYPSLKLASNIQFFYTYPAWVTNAVISADVLYANALPLFWTNICYSVTYTNGGAAVVQLNTVYTLNANSITTIYITNNFPDTLTNTVVTKQLKLWTFFTATNTANAPYIIKTRVTATGAITSTNLF